MCGCKGSSLAAFENETKSCFCGEGTIKKCDSDYCISVYDSSGYNVSFSKRPPSKVKINTPFETTVSSLNNMKVIGLLVNNRLAMYSSNLLSLLIGMPGNYSMIVEASAFYGCPNDIHKITAEVGKTVCYFNLPAQIKSENSTFIISFHLTGPDTLKKVRIKSIEGITEEFTEFLSPTASIYVEIGGNTETDRYEDYKVTFSKNKQTAVIVSLDHQISFAGEITGFSAQITVLGDIRFLIFEPACNLLTNGTAKKMCFLTKECVELSDPCPIFSNVFYSPDFNNIFYPGWNQFGSANSKFPNNLTPRLSSNIMFKLVYSFQVSAAVLGQNDFAVPTDKRFTTSAGQFLAWMPDYSNNNPGDIAYNLIDSTSQFQSIHYKEVFSIFDDQIFLDYQSSIEISDTEHMVSLYLEIPSIYFIEQTADYPDGTDFVVEAYVTDSNGAEKMLCTAKTSIVADIKNLSLSTFDLLTYVMINKVIMFNVSALSGTAKANYAVYWDEDVSKKVDVFNEIFNVSYFEHAFTKPGSYNVRVKAFTDLSSQITTILINVVCVLYLPFFVNTNEVWQSEKIKPVKTTEGEVSVDVALTGCGLITISYFLESDTLQINGSSLLWLSENSLFVIKSNLFQTQPQTLNITVCTTNTLEVHCINERGYVEDPIDNFELVLTTMETNVGGFLIVSNSTTGTNKTYCFHWGDGSLICTNGTYDVISVEHKYLKSGNYTISALAFNRVSQMNILVIQEVQDRISECIISAQPTIYNKLTHVYFKIDRGTGMNIVLDWGKPEYNKYFYFNIDVFENSLTNLKDFPSFVFPIKQDYNVCLFLYNEINEKICCTVAIVEDQIKDFHISVKQEFEGAKKTDWIEENENLVIMSNHNYDAKRVLYMVNLGNGTIFNTTYNVVNVSYPFRNLCYNYSVIATNPVSQASSWTNICIQRRLNPIYSPKFVHVPTSSKEEMSIKFTFLSGNDFDCIFNFNDKSEENTFSVSYTDFIGPIGFIEAKHHFSAGEYNVTVFCTNRLYDFFLSTIVISQDLVNEPLFEIKGRCYNGSIFNDVVPQKFFSDLFINAFCNIIVSIENQQGSNVSERGDLIIEGKYKGTFPVVNNTIEFQNSLWSGLDMCNAEITINSSNLVSQVISKLKTVKLVVPVMNFKVTVESGMHAVGVPIMYTVEFLSPVPGNPCLSINFQDGSPVQIYGGSNCKNPLDRFPNPFTRSYAFQAKNSYLVTFMVSNQISSKTQKVVFRVLDYLCSAPQIKFASSAAISEASLDSNQKAYFYKCMNITFKYTMRTNCTRPKTILVKKIIIEYKMNNVTWRKDIDEFLDEKYILIGKTLKNYGIYRVTYYGQMVDIVTKEIVEDTTSMKIGYFKVVPCPLQLIIAGGYEKTFQRGGEIVIDATQSHDPDSDSKLDVKWFCARSGNFSGLDIYNVKEKMSYPVVDPNTYKSENFLSKACFSNSEGVAIQLNDRGLLSLKLVLLTKYLWYYCYDLRLLIMKRYDPFKRQAIGDVTLCLTEKEPLYVSVKCEQNCDVLINPSSKFSISSSISNEDKCEQIIYNWKVLRTFKTGLNCTYEDITEELINKSTTKFNQRNFVLGPNSLKSTYRYKFRVNASCSKGILFGASGAAAEIKDVNSPPDVSKATCSVYPNNGSVAKSDFVLYCEGVEDEHYPLSYGFQYNCNDSWAFLTTATTVSNVTSSKFKLPPSKKESSSCSLRVIARDSYGVQSDPFPMIPLEVQVYGTPSEDLTLSLIRELKLSNLPNEQSLLANRIVVLLEMNSSISLENKELIENYLLSVWIDTPEDANLVVQNIQTEGNDTVALKTLDKVLDRFNMLNANELSDISVHILAKTSALGGQTTMEFALRVEDRVFSSIVKTLVVGEPAVSSKTPLGSTHILQIDAGAQKIGEFSLPDLGGGGAINSVGSNRYQFDKASKNVKGKVKGMTLTKPDGSQKQLKNLTEKIKLVLENDEVPPPMKNYTAYCELLRNIHQVDSTVNSSIIVLNIKPTDENFTGFFFTFMNKGRFPSLSDNQQNCTLPNPYPEDWYSLSKEKQNYWESQKKWTCYFSEKDLNKTAVGIWCIGVIYYNNTHPLTKLLLPFSSTPSEDNCSAVGYFFQAYTRACMFWDKPLNTWNTEGCETDEYETNSYQTVCHCDHLTDFGGGGPFSNAQPPDFGALKRFDLASNPTVFSVVMAIIGLYLLLLVWARKKDKGDLEKSEVIYLPENHPNDKYLYEIVIDTGFKKGCSTTADVAILITGSRGESGPRKLYSPNRKCFQKSETDIFIVALPADIGDLKEVAIWHNNAGDSPGWFLLSVQVRDMQTQTLTNFICNQWLDVTEEDGAIMRKIQPSSQEDITEFNYLFFVTMIKNFYDGHIWLSIFTRPCHSTFTRCQRLATCMSLLMTSMVANAMFYKTASGPPSPSISLGPMTLSINEMKTSVATAIIVVPCNLLITFLFKNAGPKKKSHSKYEVNKKDEVTYAARKSISLAKQEMIDVKKHNSRVKYFRALFFHGKHDNIENKHLPHWLIYIAYFISFASSVASSFFVIVYGFTFGKVTSDKWVVSMLFSFFHSVFFVQPIKIILLSLFFSVLKKIPSANGRESALYKPQTKEEEENEIKEVLFSDPEVFKLPDERKLNEFRIARLKEKRIQFILKEVFNHFSFVILVIIVAYSSADPSCFWLYKSTFQLCALNGLIKDYHFPKGKIVITPSDPSSITVIPAAADVATNTDWFHWTRYSVIEYLFPDGWYNNKMKYPAGFVADSASSKVLAMARFRQLRVSQNSCTKHPVFKYLINECNAGYSYSSEETREFKAGWLPPLNKTERFRRRKGKKKAVWKGLEDPWLYQTTGQLKNPFPFSGLINTYTGSSYSVSIGPNKRTAITIWRNLKNSFWVDRYTRALFTEINIYNANTNLMLIVTILHEVLPTGGYVYYSNVQALRLYRYVGGLGQLVIIFDLIFFGITIVSMYKIIRSSRRISVKEYFSTPWNVLHVIVTVNSVCVIAFTMCRMLAVNTAVAEYSSDPEVFVSFQFVGQLEYLTIGCLGFILFFTNLEFLRILRFNRLISLLSKSVSTMGGPLLSFGVMFLVLFMAFVTFTTCIYMDKLEDFQSIPRSFITMTTMFLGKISVTDYFNNAPFFGPIMFGSYMLSIQMVMINLFVGLICEAFTETNEEPITQDAPMVISFIFKKIKTPGNKVNEPDPIYYDWKDEFEQMVENLENNFDNCTYKLRNMEAEIHRQTMFFEQEEEIKNELLVATLGLDFFNSEVEFFDGLTTLEKKLQSMTVEDAKLFLKQASVMRLIASQQNEGED
ncbi:uncharacterized protein LOC100206152 isoform X5 [Hydra vulgaris]